jgi:starch phosphorylase
MALAADLVSGVDLWLNTPRRPLEASGTSGMKAAINAIPSLSILDGWWNEGYHGTNGWAIGGDAPQTDAQEMDETFRLLETEIVPLFFDRDASGTPRGWLPVMRSAREVGLARFTTDRMLDDATRELYRPILAEPVTA